LGLWLALAAKTVGDNILGIILPITAFVALGFDHVVANMFFLPLAMVQHVPRVTLGHTLNNLLIALLGNGVGAGGLRPPGLLVPLPAGHTGDLGNRCTHRTRRVPHQHSHPRQRLTAAPSPHRHAPAHPTRPAGSPPPGRSIGSHPGPARS